MTLLLYLPFGIEFFTYGLFRRIEPQWLGGLLFFMIYTYPAYGVLIYAYTRFRKSQGMPLSFSPRGIKGWHMAVAAASAILLRRIVLWHGGEALTPMLYYDLRAAFGGGPSLMAIGSFVLQYLYYAFEFVLVTLMVDAAQQTGEGLGRSKKVPWGGLYVGLTWGLGHVITQQSWNAGLSSLALAGVMGFLFVGFGRKPIIPLVVIACFYLL